MEEIIFLDCLENSNLEISEQDLINIENYLKTSKFGELISFLKSKDYFKQENFKPDDFLLQIILTIYVFCLLKLQKYDQVSLIFNKVNYGEEFTLFPWYFLEGKYYFAIVKNISYRMIMRVLLTYSTES
jgi:hypothetical protein